MRPETEVTEPMFREQRAAIEAALANAPRGGERAAAPPPRSARSKSCWAPGTSSTWTSRSASGSASSASRLPTPAEPSVVASPTLVAIGLRVENSMTNPSGATFPRGFALMPGGDRSGAAHGSPSGPAERLSATGESDASADPPPPGGFTQSLRPPNRSGSTAPAGDPARRPCGSARRWARDAARPARGWPPRQPAPARRGPTTSGP